MDLGGSPLSFLKSMGALVLALVLQTTVVELISLGPIRPDLVIIVLVAISLRHGSVVGLYCGFMIGLAQDVYAIQTLGANALAKSLIGFMAGLADQRVVKITPGAMIFFLALAFCAHDFVLALAGGVGMGVMFWERSLPAGLYTVLAGALVYYLIPSSAKLEQ